MKQLFFCSFSSQGLEWHILAEVPSIQAGSQVLFPINHGACWLCLFAGVVNVLMLKPFPFPGFLCGSCLWFYFFIFLNFYLFIFFPACAFKGLLFHAFLVHALPNEPLESDVRRSWLHPLEETCLWSFLKDSHGGHQLWPWRISERMEWSCTPEDVGSEAGMWKELDTPWFICFLMTVTSMKPLPQHRSSDGHWGCSDK